MTVYQSTFHPGRGIIFPADVAQSKPMVECAKCHGPAAVESFQQWTGGAWYDVVRVRCSGLAPMKRDERIRLRRERGLRPEQPVRCNHTEERSRVPRPDLRPPDPCPQRKREEPDPMSKTPCPPETRAAAADVVDKITTFKDAVASGIDSHMLRGAMAAEVAARKRGATLRPETSPPVAEVAPAPADPAPAAAAPVAYSFELTPIETVRPAEFRKRMAALVASDDVADYLALPYGEQDTIRRLVMAL